MSNFVERLKVEIKELEIRIKKLNDFQESDTFKNLAAPEQDLLMLQLSAMATYHGIMIIRFKIYTAGESE